MKTKMYKAFVKSKETGELKIIEGEYASKKDFAHDLRVNGYAVKFVSTPEKFDEDCENYHWELKRRKNVREAIKQHKAKSAEAVEETPVTESKEQEFETAEETETETETTVVETSEQTEETKDENTHIWVTKEAYFFLKNEMRKQRGFKPLTKKQKERILIHITKNGMSNKIRLNHNSLGGGDGTKDGRWWGWNVVTLKKLLKKAGYSYET